MLIIIVMISLLAIVAVPRFATANGRRHMESARMRVAAGLATARQAAIQKGQTVKFRIKAHRVTVFVVTGPGAADTLPLMSPVPLDTLYKITAKPEDAGGPIADLVLNFTSRGYTNTNPTTIALSRAGVRPDTIKVTKFGTVQQW
jgi:type II secretory pathway pseudopilin PulG